MYKMGGLVLALGLASGCTTYSPHSSPRIAEVSAGYTRDGQLHSHGAFGSGLEEVVRGNREAEEHAATFRRLSIAGFSLDIGGLALCAGGGALVGKDSSSGAGVGLLGAGAGLVLVGVILGAVAVPHKIDAINIYNDGVSAKSTALGPRRDVEFAASKMR